ncbi:MAG TPA: DUF3310 domain-containing protein [Terriglobia bacterium]|nr:DUF3310 domain-containing protein [Terriglobia bacterium]
MAGRRASDSVNHPAHYNAGGIEVISAIEAWGLGFCLGNTVKYIARAGKKDPAKTIEDLQKARWYLDRHIECLVVTKSNQKGDSSTDR